MKIISQLHTPYKSYLNTDFKIVEGEENIISNYEKGHINAVTTHKVYRIFNTNTDNLIAKIYAGSGVSVNYDTIKNDSK